MTIASVGYMKCAISNFGHNQSLNLKLQQMPATESGCQCGESKLEDILYLKVTLHLFFLTLQKN